MRKYFMLPLMAATILAVSPTKYTVAQNTTPYWSAAGNNNGGTSPKLGNTNATPLRLITNNSTRIYISPSAGNVGVGTASPAQKLDVNGNINLAKGNGLYLENHRVLSLDSIKGSVFLGNGAGTKNTATYNTAIGYQSLSNNTSGYYNTATGTFALLFNTTGSENVANGAYTLVNNTTGLQNTATGVNALYNNTVGSNNVASGHGALFINTKGTSNVAVGDQALYNNTIGYFNTATGAEALHSNTTAYANVANGYRALYLNTDGGGNTGVGSYSLYSNVSGAGNTAVGHNALTKNNGSGNTAVGDNALAFCENTRFNTSIGFQSGYLYLQGYYNTFLGSNATSNQSGLYNAMALGNEAIVTAPNQVRIGNSSTTSIGGTTGWSNVSDGRVKRNVKENVPGLAFINKLKPVTYNLDLDAAEKIMGVAASLGENGKPIAKQLTQTEIAARAAKQKIVYTGFVAQDVEKAAKDLNYDFSGVDAAKNDRDLYALRYSEFVVPLVKAVQELSEENSEFKSRIEKLETLISKTQSQGKSVQALKIPVVNEDAFLQQNTPNPASGITHIAYTVPKTANNAQLALTDNTGNKVQTVTLAKSGIVEINTAGLSSGIYQYSMIAGGKVFQTKQLTVAH